MISWRQQFMKFFSTNHFCVLLALKFACNPKNSPTTSFRSSVRFCFRTHVPFAISQMTTFLLPNLRTREFVWIDQNMYKRILNAGSIYCKSKFSWSCKWKNLCFLPCQEKVCQSFQFTWARYIHKETLLIWMTLYTTSTRTNSDRYSVYE